MAPTTSPTIWAAAKAVLERRGWHQGMYYADWDTIGDCAVCLVGALNVACHGWPTPVEAADHPVCAAWGASTRLSRHLAQSAIDWQDRTGRSLHQVYDLLDEMDRREREAAGT